MLEMTWSWKLMISQSWVTWTMWEGTRCCLNTYDHPFYPGLDHHGKPNSVGSDIDALRKNDMTYLWFLRTSMTTIYNVILVCVIVLIVSWATLFPVGRLCKVATWTPSYYQETLWLECLSIYEVTLEAGMLMLSIRKKKKWNVKVWHITEVLSLACKIDFDATDFISAMRQ